MLADYVLFVDEGCIDEEQHVIATFEVEVQNDFTIEEAARIIAYDPTIGTWTSIGVERESLLGAFSGKVLLPLPRASAQRGRIRIAIPLAVTDPALGGIPHLMAILGAPFGLRRIKTLRLVNIEFPEQFLAVHPGPSFGMEGIYQLLGYKVGRPLLATMLKPRSGLDTQAYAQMAFEALSGGIDIIFDDELMVSPRSAPLEERVPVVKEAVLSAEQKTHSRKLYAVNVTSSVRRIIEVALKAKELGADVLYVNPLVTGLSVLELLATSDEIDLPIFCCRSMHGVFQRGQNGIAMYVLLKLARLAGADAMHVGSISGKLPHRIVEDHTELRSHARVLLDEMKGLKCMLPILSGGMHPGNVEWNVRKIGPSVIIQAGSGVLGHPDGPRCGGKAMWDAVEAFLSDQPTPLASRKSKELQRALEKWGYLAQGEVQDVR